MPRKNYLPLAAGAAAALLLIVVLAAVLGGRSRKVETGDVYTEAGVSYLRQLEQRDPEVVVQTLKDQYRARLEALREERLEQLDSGKISVWSLFEDYALLGDSRAVGFSFYDFLPEERVLAESGARITDLEERIPDLQALNPSTLFLCYGLNDVAIGYWPTPDEYTAEYARILREVQRALPGVEIYISSILPARDPAFNQYPVWYDIPQYSAAVRVMCDSIDNCWYVDNTALAETYADLYEPDGIHLTRDFYPHWAANLITEVYSSHLDWAGAEEDEWGGDAYDEG